jgi:hypothetical protein
MRNARDIEVRLFIFLSFKTQNTIAVRNERERERNRRSEGNLKCGK